jgi:hypothetical protein
MFPVGICLLYFEKYRRNFFVQKTCKNLSGENGVPSVLVRRDPEFVCKNAAGNATILNRGFKIKIVQDMTRKCLIVIVL